MKATPPPRRSDVQVGAGSLQGVVLKSGLVDPVTVPVVFGAAGTGDVRFAVSVPTSTGVDYVHGIIEEKGTVLEPALTSSGTRRAGVFEVSGLAGGTYTLVLTFTWGGAAGSVAGVFREKLVVTEGFTSGSWVGPNGALLAERAISETEFASPEASLVGLVVGGVFDGTFFNPSTLTYNKTLLAGLPTSISFTATGSRPGQYLEYSWNGAGFIEIRSGTSSPSLTTGTYNTLGVRVTAPDRSTKTVYWVTFGGEVTEGVTYSLAVPRSRQIHPDRGESDHHRPHRNSDERSHTRLHRRVSGDRDRRRGFHLLHILDLRRHPRLGHDHQRRCFLQLHIPNFRRHTRFGHDYQ